MALAAACVHFLSVGINLGASIIPAVSHPVIVVFKELFPLIIAAVRSAWEGLRGGFHEGPVQVRAVFNPDDRCNPGKVLPQRNSCAEVAKWPQMVAKVLDETSGDPTPGAPNS